MNDAPGVTIATLEGGVGSGVEPDDLGGRNSPASPTMEVDPGVYIPALEGGVGSGVAPGVPIATLEGGGCSGGSNKGCQ